MKTLVGLAFLLTLSCASGSIPVASGPVAPETIDERWSLHVVTVDADGDERVTRIWIAVLDGDPILRTGESRWWENLQRDPTIRIRLSGTDRVYRAELVTDPSQQVRIDEVFLEKYGLWERVLFSQERGETHTNYARLRQ
ncbi:MAG: DUF2255 family protein [Myxococcota bacterium]|jgi:hypothetical protein|nr:DUF2255 family protein [Myxococcota bacterium]